MIGWVILKILKVVAVKTYLKHLRENNMEEELKINKNKSPLQHVT